MEQKKEKDIVKLLAVGLAFFIVVGALGGGILLFSSGKHTSYSGEKVEKKELVVIAPNEKELKTVDQITISTTGSETGDAEEVKDDSMENEDYILPESNTKLLTNADIAGLSLKELNYAKNEIYARHGRKFKSEELQKYFESKSWYEGKYEGTDFDKNYSDKLLSETEKKNAEFLSSAEKSLSENGYELDK